VRAVSGAHDREVPLVAPGDARLAQTLSEGDGASMTSPRSAFIRALQLAGARQIGIGWISDPVYASVTAGDVVNVSLVRSREWRP
jgi:hypothetical protein